MAVTVGSILAGKRPTCNGNPEHDIRSVLSQFRDVDFRTLHDFYVWLLKHPRPEHDNVIGCSSRDLHRMTLLGGDLATWFLDDSRPYSVGIHFLDGEGEIDRTVFKDYRICRGVESSLSDTERYRLLRWLVLTTWTTLRRFQEVGICKYTPDADSFLRTAFEAFNGGRLITFEETPSTSIAFT